MYPRLIINIIGTCLPFFLAMTSPNYKGYYATLALAGFMGFMLSCIDYVKEKK